MASQVIPPCLDEWTSQPLLSLLYTLSKVHDTLSSIPGCLAILELLSILAFAAFAALFLISLASDDARTESHTIHSKSNENQRGVARGKNGESGGGTFVVAETRIKNR